MAGEERAQGWPLQAPEPWPPHDTEESIVGTNLHQTTIVNLRLGLNQAAHAGLQPEESVPWYATDQILLLGCRRPDGSYYRTYPDVMVYAQHEDLARTAMTIDADGPPVLIIEVLSESTFEVDIDLDRGKGYSYARAGVAEYLVLDPTGHYLHEGIRAWHLVGDAYRPWIAAAEGRWESRQVPAAIGLEGVWATVYSTVTGQPMLRERQIHAALEQKDARLADLEAELARLRTLLEDGR